MSKELTQEYLKECISYNKLTGDVIRIKRPLSHFKSSLAHSISNSKITGKPVAAIHKNKNGKSYLKFKLNGKHYLLHRIIWLFVTGEWPEFIDHKNGNGLCNKWRNLRNGDMTMNNRNLRMPHTNTTGHIGVYFDKRYGNWYACIWSNNKQLRIGTFASFEDAKQARISAEKQHKYHKNHGSNRPL